MGEELGGEVQYSLGEPKVFFRVERVEEGISMPVRIFAVEYEAWYKNGEIKLGKSHDEFRWVNVEEFKPEEFFEGGWLKGLQEYIRLQQSR